MAAPWTQSAKKAKGEAFPGLSYIGRVLTFEA